MTRSVFVVLFLCLLIGLFHKLGENGLFRIWEHEKQIIDSNWNDCKEITSPLISVGGAEDADILSFNPPRFILSLDPNRKEYFIDKEEKNTGALAIFYPEDGKIVPLELPESVRPIHPHGISVYFDFQDNVKHIYLFVINHSHHHRDQVLIFELIDYEKLKLINEISNDLFTSLNDVVGINDHQFYVTNDHKRKGTDPLSIIEDLIPPFSGSNLVFCSIDECQLSIPSGEIAFLNGVNVSPYEKDNSKYLYVSSPIRHSIIVYERISTLTKDGLDSGNLKYLKEIQLNTGVDNIMIERSSRYVDSGIIDTSIETSRVGTLWLGCHPNSFKFLIHAFDPQNNAAPSHVLQIQSSSGDLSSSVVIKEVYRSGGNEAVDVSASSSAVCLGPHLIITPDLMITSLL